MKNGAGVDLLIYLTIAKQYSFIKISKYSNAIFREHAQSFSSMDGNIVKYYFRAMIFFLPVINNKSLYDYFSIYLKRLIFKNATLKEEYRMIPRDKWFVIRLLYTLPYYFFYMIKYKILYRQNRWQNLIFK